MLKIYLIWNGVVFLLYGADKYKAAHGKWRISERALLLCALLMGAGGGAAGMLIFRHKTRKIKFTLLVPLCAALNAVFACLILRYIG